MSVLKENMGKSDLAIFPDNERATHLWLLPLLLLAAMIMAPVAMAQDGFTFDGFRENAGLPIEVTADSLEVTQNDQVAKFSGSVRAKQGKLGLYAEILQIYYNGSDSKPDTKASNDNSADDAASSAIHRMEAQGNVVLASPSERAEGDWIVYDIGAAAITVGGNVTLQRGPNKLSGSLLTIDLNTGRSRIEGQSKGSSGRVKGVFVPPKKTQ